MVTKARWVGRGVRLRSQRLTPKFARVAQFGRARNRRADEYAVRGARKIIRDAGCGAKI